ncbi:MAG TPA: hypothetical protein VJG90_01805 [Candidatus Nanoarchaeia archaeon]|nr:hypothetical protein [Candidatus Nanoarchaeia archaeon]
MKPVAQEHGMGCAVACVASVLSISYKKALLLFDKPENAWGRGFYCPEICKALSKGGKKYEWRKINSKDKSFEEGVIVFTREDKKDHLGHYLTKTKKGWMDPWINYPSMIPAKASFCKKLSGKPLWLIFPV